MPVLTQKEFENQGKISIKNSPIIQSKKSRGLKSPAKDCFLWYLLHPENGADGDMQNFNDVINIDGIDYKRECINGVVKTKDEILVEFLIYKGYKLMEKIRCQ